MVFRCNGDRSPDRRMAGQPYHGLRSSSVNCTLGSTTRWSRPNTRKCVEKRSFPWNVSRVPGVKPGGPVAIVGLGHRAVWDSAPDSLDSRNPSRKELYRISNTPGNGAHSFTFSPRSGIASVRLMFLTPGNEDLGVMWDERPRRQHQVGTNKNIARKRASTSF
jgi:hypothetical protein